MIYVKNLSAIVFQCNMTLIFIYIWLGTLPQIGENTVVKQYLLGSRPFLSGLSSYCMGGVAISQNESFPYTVIRLLVCGLIFYTSSDCFVFLRID